MFLSKKRYPIFQQFLRNWSVWGEPAGNPPGQKCQTSRQLSGIWFLSRWGKGNRGKGNRASEISGKMTELIPKKSWERTIEKGNHARRLRSTSCQKNRQLVKIHREKLDHLTPKNSKGTAKNTWKNANISLWLPKNLLRDADQMIWPYRVQLLRQVFIWSQMRGTRCLTHVLPIFFRMTLVNADTCPCQQTLIRSAWVSRPHIKKIKGGWTRWVKPLFTSLSPSAFSVSNMAFTSEEEKKRCNQKFLKQLRCQVMGDQVKFNQHASLTLAIPEIQQWTYLLLSTLLMLFQSCNCTRFPDERKPTKTGKKNLTFRLVWPKAAANVRKAISTVVSLVHQHGFPAETLSNYWWWLVTTIFFLCENHLAE